MLSHLVRVDFQLVRSDFLASCVEPLCLYLEGLAFCLCCPPIFNCYLLAVLSLFYLFLRASFALLGCVEPLPMSLGTKFSLHPLDLLWLLLGFWVIWLGFLFSLLPTSFFLFMICCGVDNALIKGEIADTWVYAESLCDE